MEQAKMNELKLDDGEMTHVPPLNETEVQEQMEQIPPIGGTFDSGLNDVITQEDFYNGFKSVFAFAGEYTATNSLTIQSHEEQGARRTSDKLYEMALKYPFLRFMIDTKTTWLADASLIGLFVYGKPNAVFDEKTGYGLNKIIFGRLGKWLPKRKGSGFLARLGLGKRPKHEQSSETQND